jgi:Domain of unknown function (DUF4326)
VAAVSPYPAFADDAATQERAVFGTAMCTVCWREQPLSPIGNLRFHMAPDAAWNLAAEVCDGARKPPGAILRTTVVNLKGHRDRYGPGLAEDGWTLERAPHVWYVGRTQSQGGWRLLRQSPFRNPFSAQKVGGAERAVELYREWLAEQPDLMDRARRELRGRALGCWCSPRPCHATVLADLVNELYAPSAVSECGDGYAGAVPVKRDVVTIRPRGAARGLL